MIAHDSWRSNESVFQLSSTIMHRLIGSLIIRLTGSFLPPATDGTPFTERCIKVNIIKPPRSSNGTTVNYSCNGRFFMVDIATATLLPNGSIWIPLHKRSYINGSYFINGSSLFVCMNLTRNFTETTTLFSKDTKITARQIITYLGCAISMIFLTLLLGFYITFVELRTLPGKNLMSLSCAMLLYHIAFLLTGQTDNPYLCTTVSALLHYCLLASFCWMSVMAFDVAKTFGVKGNKYSTLYRLIDQYGQQEWKFAVKFKLTIHLT